MAEDQSNTQEEPAADGAENGGAPRKMSTWGIPPASERPVITVNGIYTVAWVFTDKVFKDPNIARGFYKSKMILRMEYFDPENWGDETPTVTIDLSLGKLRQFFGECGIKPIVTLTMHGDTAHKFWMQKINIMTAVLRRQIIPKGPLPQLMRLLPLLKKSYPLYKETLLDLGLIDLLNYPEPCDMSTLPS